MREQQQPLLNTKKNNANISSHVRLEIIGPQVGDTSEMKERLVTGNLLQEDGLFRIHS